MGDSRIMEVTDEEAEKFMKNDKKEIKNPVEKENETAEKVEKETKETDKEEEDPEDKGKLKPNSGNGCDLPHGRYVNQFYKIQIINMDLFLILCVFYITLGDS